MTLLTLFFFYFFLIYLCFILSKHIYIVKKKITFQINYDRKILYHSSTFINIIKSLLFYNLLLLYDLSIYISKLIVFILLTPTCWYNKNYTYIYKKKIYIYRKIIL